jgi:hypothetical protein
MTPVEHAVQLQDRLVGTPNLHHASDGGREPIQRQQAPLTQT